MCIWQKSKVNIRTFTYVQAKTLESEREALGIFWKWRIIYFAFLGSEPYIGKSGF